LKDIASKVSGEWRRYRAVLMWRNEDEESDELVRRMAWRSSRAHGLYT
jgi:hypothetical protein